MYDDRLEQPSSSTTEFRQQARREAIKAMMNPCCTGLRNSANSYLLLARSDKEYVMPLLNIIERFPDPGIAMDYYRHTAFPCLVRAEHQPSQEQEISFYSAIIRNPRADKIIKQEAGGYILELQRKTGPSMSSPNGNTRAQGQPRPA